MEQNFYDGLRGHRRVKTLEKHIERISEEFATQYADTPEMVFLEESIQWEGPSKLIFLMAQRNVHFAWNGLRDYGFIRLCKKWIIDNEITVLSAKAAGTMIRSILPVQMCEDLGDEITALEII